jgi:dTDP-4-dehydrorhamnose reductase
VRLVVLGSGGRVGAAMARIYGQSAEVFAFNRRELDLASEEALEKTLGPLKFDVLVNCAGATSLEYCEMHEEEAFAVNARAVRMIAEICHRKQARCIHLSTDYVFDGTQMRDYTEEDVAEAINVYGRSKRAGELELLSVSEDFLAVRVSWVFGPDRPGFVEQLLQRAISGGAPLAGVGDKWSVPTSVYDIISELRPFLREIPVGGLLHLTQSGGACTWHEYGQYALDCAARAGVPLKERVVVKHAMSEVSAFVARRPVYTAMATRRLELLTGRAPRPWQEALEEYVRSISAC